MAAALTVHDIEVEDVEYLRFGNTALLARLYKPRGDGPFPLLVDLHGGAWCRGDRLNDVVISEALAHSGVAVAALDFRMPPAASYPASLTDIHYGIRWLRTRADTLGLRVDKVGALGVSSGGHQAMLLAMRPQDERYAAFKPPYGVSDVAMRLDYVVLCWPVIDPLARYHYAKKLRDGGEPYPELVDRVLPCHDQYWRDEAAMAEGNPVLALERGEAVELPPVLYVQGTEDIAHPRPDLDRFVEQYRKAGGQVELKLFDGEAEGFINRKPTSAVSGQAVTQIIEFVHRHMG